MIVSVAFNLVSFDLVGVGALGRIQTGSSFEDSDVIGVLFTCRSRLLVLGTERFLVVPAGIEFTSLLLTFARVVAFVGFETDFIVTGAGEDKIGFGTGNEGLGANLDV